MPEAMTKRKRDNAIRDAMLFNEQVHELDQTVAQFREHGQNEIVAGLSRVADHLNFELRETVMDLVRKNLGPQSQRNLMLVFRKAGEWLDAEKAALQPKGFLGLRIAPSSKDARTLRDLDYFETFLRCMAKDVLRAMAEHNWQRMA